MRHIHDIGELRQLGGRLLGVHVGGDVKTGYHARELVKLVDGEAELRAKRLDVGNWSALTALVLENSMADSLSWRYCSSVPSTVLRTPVREVSILTAAAPVATATPVMAAVTGTSFCPAASILAPVLYISPPALAS